MFPNRKRPARLSNQGCCVSDEELAEAHAKRLEELTAADYDVIFEIAGCTATYDERLYYLPHALALMQARPDSFVTPSLLYFLSTNAKQLERDGFLAPAIAALRATYAAWTREFREVHYDAAACRAKEWTVDHLDLVVGSEDLRELVGASLRHGTFGWLAEEVVASWVAPGSRAEDAAWLLELAHREHGYGTIAHSSPIYSLIGDDEVLQAQYDRIRDTLVAAEPSPTYWRDVANDLALRRGRKR